MGKLKALVIEREEAARLANLKSARRLEKEREAEQQAYRAQLRKAARTEKELYDLAVAWGYKNPTFWAKQVLEGRRR